MHIGLVCHPLLYSVLKKALKGDIVSAQPFFTPLPPPPPILTAGSVALAPPGSEDPSAPLGGAGGFLFTVSTCGASAWRESLPPLALRWHCPYHEAERTPVGRPMPSGCLWRDSGEDWVGSGPGGPRLSPVQSFLSLVSSVSCHRPLQPPRSPWRKAAPSPASRRLPQGSQGREGSPGPGGVCRLHDGGPVESG